MLGFDDPKFLELMRLGGMRGMIRLLLVTYLLESEEVCCLNILFVSALWLRSSISCRGGPLIIFFVKQGC
jgi:hypothetical protein